MADVAHDRVWTVPNAITLLRLALLAPVCWFILTGTQGSWLPVILLGVWASTDWVDGLLDAGEKFYEKNGYPLYSSHMLDLSEEPLHENVEISAK